MKWASAISENPILERAVLEATGVLSRELGGAKADLVIVFVSPHYAEGYQRIPELILSTFPGSALVGCSANGVIGAGHEVEQRPALSLTAASLPGVQLGLFHLTAVDFPEDTADLEAWRALVRTTQARNLHFLLFADPFTFDATALLEGLDAAYPDSRKAGGLASGGQRPGANALYLGPRVHNNGAVGVALSGNISLETIVAQGCRPIGTPMMITRCEKNVLIEVDGRPPVRVLQQLYESLGPKDRDLFRTSLFVGLEMKSEAVEAQTGEFLVRNLVEMDPETGAVAIGALPKQWQAMQFLLRDAKTATEDLTRLLARYSGQPGRSKPQGALLFSCLGRGIHLFGQPDHDTDLFRQRLGSVPLGGFFCNGEIGPVGANTFLHGYTSAFALFGEAERN